MLVPVSPFTEVKNACTCVSILPNFSRRRASLSTAATLLFKENTYQMLIGQPGERRVFARTRLRRVNDTKIDLQ